VDALRAVFDASAIARMSADSLGLLSHELRQSIGAITVTLAEVQQEQASRIRQASRSPEERTAIENAKFHKLKALQADALRLNRAQPPSAWVDFRQINEQVRREHPELV
jgi:hypothetical protein